MLLILINTSSAKNLYFVRYCFTTTLLWPPPSSAVIGYLPKPIRCVTASHDPSQQRFRYLFILTSVACPICTGLALSEDLR